MIDLAIFDLDGTLIDSKLDLAHAVNATRTHMGLKPLEHDMVFSYVGNGAPVLIRRALGPEFSDADIQRALDYFLGYYRDHMLDYTELYPGVKQSLDRLRDAGVKMAVLTNKPVRFSHAIVAGLGISGYFERVYGGNSFEQKKPHPIGVDTLLTDCAARRECTVLVGDSSVDIQTARNARIRSCGVTYGFQPETLAADPPDLLVDRMEQFVDAVVTQAFPPAPAV